MELSMRLNVLAALLSFGFIAAIVLDVMSAARARGWRTPSRRPRVQCPQVSRINAGDFRTLERQIIHQTFLIEDESNDGTFDLIGVDGATNADCYKRHRSIDPDFPPMRTAKTPKRLFCHEDDDDGSDLHTKLKAD